MDLIAALAALTILITSLGSPKTTVILLPDDDGSVGAVTITANAESRQLDRAYDAVATARSGDLLATQTLDEATVLRDHAALLKAQPPKPASFNLYFASGSATPDAEAQAVVDQVIGEIGERRASTILIAGHTDATGSDSANLALSQQRAVAVEALVRQRLPDIERIMILYFGAKDPLVKVAPDVAEPRNRRVEVVVY